MKSDVQSLKRWVSGKKKNWSKGREEKKKSITFPSSRKKKKKKEVLLNGIQMVFD